MSRTLLVTGASSGIGRACAKRLLQQGHTVIGTSRDCQKFNAPHARFIPISLDFAQFKASEQTLKQLNKDFPMLDGIVFAAGYGQFGSLEQFSAQQIEQMIQVNFTSQALITRLLIAQLKRQARSNLIYIGSEAALQGRQKGTIYCASKFALRGFTQALQEECSRSSVRVSLVNPGMVNTPFFDRLSFTPGTGITQSLSADDIADAISYILNANPNIRIDEINLNPATKVISFKKNQS